MTERSPALAGAIWFTGLLLFASNLASAGPNAGGTLILHANPSLAFTSTIENYCGMSALDSCSAAVTSVAWDPGKKIVFHAIAAFPPGSSPRLKALSFGIDFDSTKFVMAARGTCADFEIPGVGWPAPGTGTSQSWTTGTRTGLLTECYWFAGYVYSEQEAEDSTSVALIPHPVQHGVFVDDTFPSEVDTIAAYGRLGFGTSGLLACPDQPVETSGPAACCVGESCTLLDNIQCARIDGIFMREVASCAPSPCEGALPAIRSAGFIENVGQRDPRIRYYSYGLGAQLFFTDDGLVVDVTAPIASDGLAGSSFRGHAPSDANAPYDNVLVTHYAVLIHIPGVPGGAIVSASRRQTTLFNFFRGRDPAFWKTQVHAFYRVAYERSDREAPVTFGIGSTSERFLSMTLPTPLTSVDEFQVQGAEDTSVSADGSLRIALSSFAELVISPVDESGTRYVFGLARRGPRDEKSRKASDTSTPLPWSTFLGGSGWDTITSTVTNLSGKIVVAGSTTSVDFPVTWGSYQIQYWGACDAFVSTFEPGGALIWSTYLGGEALDIIDAITLDEGNCVYATGQTRSSAFPTTPGAFQRTRPSAQSAFVAKISNVGGSSLLYSTYLGGPSCGAYGRAIAIDDESDQFRAVVAGSVYGPTFPVTPNAFDVTSNSWDGFVAKLNGSGSSLVWATYLGGSAGDELNGVCIGTNHQVVVTGYTSSDDFPVCNGFPVNNWTNRDDATVTIFHISGGSLMFSTFLGGSGDDYGQAIAVNPDKTRFVVVGSTTSSDFPVTATGFDQTQHGCSDAFAVELTNAAYPTLSCGTFFGGSGSDEATSVYWSRNGEQIVIAGSTTSVDIPTMGGALGESSNGGKDGMVAAFSPSLFLNYGSYIGGSADEELFGCAESPEGTCVVVGGTSSADFPTSPGAFQESFGGGVGDGAIARLLLPAPAAGVALPPRDVVQVIARPNPLTTETVIDLVLPRTCHVEACILGVDGRRIRTLQDGVVASGRQQLMWDGNDRGGRAVESGVYFLNVSSSEGHLTKKLLVVR